jgi:hypothetical protein
MANTSATGGPLLPALPGPAADIDLDAIVQAFVRALTSLPGECVLPRWQPVNDPGDALPPIPDVSVNWCACGATNIARDTNPALVHNGAGDGSTTLLAHETITFDLSFYGPNGEAYAGLVRDAFYISQNREPMLALGLAFYDVSDLRRVPEIVSMRTRRRTDLTLRLRRCVARVYPILNVLEGQGTILADGGDSEGSVVLTQPFQTPEN